MDAPCASASFDLPVRYHADFAIPWATVDAAVRDMNRVSTPKPFIPFLLCLVVAPAWPAASVFVQYERHKTMLYGATVAWLAGCVLILIVSSHLWFKRYHRVLQLKCHALTEFYDAANAKFVLERTSFWSSSLFHRNAMLGGVFRHTLTLHVVGAEEILPCEQEEAFAEDQRMGGGHAAKGGGEGGRHGAKEKSKGTGASQVPSRSASRSALAPLPGAYSKFCPQCLLGTGGVGAGHAAGAWIDAEGGTARVRKNLCHW